MSERFRVSDQTIETAVETAARAIDTITGRAHPEWYVPQAEKIDEALAAAVLPSPVAEIEQRVHEQIASEIRERAHAEVELHQCSVEEMPLPNQHFRLGLLRAAEVARGGGS